MATHKKAEDICKAEINSNDIYYTKYLKLLTRCEEYKLENEKLINHIYKVKQFIFEYKKQRR